MAGPEIWLTVGMGAGDLKGKVYLIGVSSSEASGKQKEERPEVEKAVTILMDGTLGLRLQGWLREQGLEAEQSLGVVRSVIQRASKVLDLR